MVYTNIAVERRRVFFWYVRGLGSPDALTKLYWNETVGEKKSFFPTGSTPLVAKLQVHMYTVCVRYVRAGNRPSIHLSCSGRKTHADVVFRTRGFWPFRERACVRDYDFRNTCNTLFFVFRFWFRLNLNSVRRSFKSRFFSYHVSLI